MNIHYIFCDPDADADRRLHAILNALRAAFPLSQIAVTSVCEPVFPPVVIVNPPDEKVKTAAYKVAKEASNACVCAAKRRKPGGCPASSWTVGDREALQSVRKAGGAPAGGLVESIPEHEG